MKTMLSAFAMIAVAGVALWAVLDNLPGNSTASFYAAGSNVNLPAVRPDEPDN